MGGCGFEWVDWWLSGGYVVEWVVGGLSDWMGA